MILYSTYKYIVTISNLQGNGSAIAFNWLSDKATAEWVQLFAVDMFRVMRNKKQMGALAKLVQKDSQLQKFLRDFQELVGV